MSWRTPMIMTFSNVSTIGLPLFEISGNYRVDWGYDNIDQNTLYHDYGSNVNPTVKIYVSTLNGSKIGRFGGGLNTFSVWTGSNKLTAITQWGDFNGLTTINRLGADALNEVPSDLPSTVINTHFMFYFASNFNHPNIVNWNVINVTDMQYMFAYANIFNQDISKWDVSNVRNMSVFLSAADFNQDISKWNVSKVTDMSFMFNNAADFNQDIGEWNVSNVINMRNMFSGATSFSPLNLSNTLIGWNEKITETPYTANTIENMLPSRSIYDSGLAALNELLDDKSWTGSTGYATPALEDPLLVVSYNEPTTRAYILNEPIEPTYNPSFLMDTSNADIEFTITPDLPSGIDISLSTGIISGTPTSLSGVTLYTIDISGNSEETTADISLSVIEI